MGRQGLWKCPNCGKHQIWKVRSASTSKLDRSCTSCGERVRATLDRSPSGKGRRGSVDIWERSIKLDYDQSRIVISVCDQSGSSVVLHYESCCYCLVEVDI